MSAKHPNVTNVNRRLTSKTAHVEAEQESPGHTPVRSSDVLASLPSNRVMLCLNSRGPSFGDSAIVTFASPRTLY